LHSSVLERTESDLSKINSLRGVILLNPIVLVSWGRFPLCHTLLSDLNLDCGLRDHVITRFASSADRRIFNISKEKQQRLQVSNIFDHNAFMILDK